MENSIIERQRELLANLDGGGELPLSGVQDEAGAGAPPPDPQAGDPGQDSLAAGAPGAVVPAQPTGGQPSPQGGAVDVEALKQQITDLTRKAEEAHTLYLRQHGMVAPLQRKTADQERKIAELEQQVEDLKKIAAAPGSTPATPNAQAPSSTPNQDDPEMKEFLSLYGDMVPGLESLIKRRIDAATKHLQPAAEFVQQRNAEAERSALLANHLAPLYVRHPNAAQTINSPKFHEWVGKKPSFVSDPIRERLLNPENFPIDQIIAIFDEFSSANPAQPPVDTSSVPGPGDMAVDFRRVPTSSTPGGKPPLQILSRERMNFINRALTVDRGSYTADQIASLQAELDEGERAANNAGFGMAPRLDTLTR